MTYTRITAVWSGAAGLPGYSRFRFLQDATSASEALALANRVKTFFGAIASLIPAGVTINFAEAAQIYDQGANLIGEQTFTPPAATAGTGAGSFSSPTGVVVNWVTGHISGGRKIRGRTFLVPISGTAFGTGGGPTAGTVTTITNAAAAMAVPAPPLVVQYGLSGTSPGVDSVIGASVPARAAVLRSRRD